MRESPVLPSVFPVQSSLAFGPTTDTLLRSFLRSCASPHTRRAYRKSLAALDDFAAGRPLSPALLHDWRDQMARRSAPATVNLRLAAVRLFVRQAQRQRQITAEYAAELLDVRSIKQRGQRAGTWLTAAEAVRLLAVPDRDTLRGKRNYCVLAILLGCALRRSELAALTVEHLQMRDERWIIENLRGKGGRVRSVAVPGWVRDAIAAWLFPAGIRSGLLLRKLNGEGGLSVDSIMEIVAHAADDALDLPNFTPHDLRRTCAKLARKNGGELEQIQFLLGHASLVTTERYLGSSQDLKTAVNDNLGLSLGGHIGGNSKGQDHANPY